MTTKIVLGIILVFAIIVLINIRYYIWYKLARFCLRRWGASKRHLDSFMGEEL